MASRQLLAYTFGSDSRFEGQLVGALERIESDGAMRVLDALFVVREPDSGELSAFSLAARAEWNEVPGPGAPRGHRKAPHKQGFSQRAR